MKNVVFISALSVFRNLDFARIQGGSLFLTRVPFDFKLTNSESKTIHHSNFFDGRLVYVLCRVAFFSIPTRSQFQFMLRSIVVGRSSFYLFRLCQLFLGCFLAIILLQPILRICLRKAFFYRIETLYEEDTLEQILSSDCFILSNYLDLDAQFLGLFFKFKTGKPVKAVVHSWDNLESKCYFILSPDVWSVWGGWQKKRILDRFAPIQPDQVFVNGLPYNMPIAGETVEKKNGKFKLLLLGSNRHLFKNQQQSIKLIFEQINRCVSQGMDIEVTYRPHPGDVIDKSTLAWIKNEWFKLSVGDTTYFNTFNTAQDADEVKIVVDGLFDQPDDIIDLISTHDLVCVGASTTLLPIIALGTPFYIVRDFNLPVQNEWILDAEHFKGLRPHILGNHCVSLDELFEFIRHDMLSKLQPSKALKKKVSQVGFFETASTRRLHSKKFFNCWK